MDYIEERTKLEKIKATHKMQKIKIKKQTKEAHNAFVVDHKKWLKVLDIVMIFVVVLNYGAVLITNMLVVQDNPTIQLREANPVQSEMNEYGQHPEGNDIMRALLIQTAFWVFLISFYIYNRRYLYTYKQLYILSVIMVYYGFMITLDFINDFGYLVGIWIWGA